VRRLGWVRAVVVDRGHNDDVAVEHQFELNHIQHEAPQAS
jgi:hypothetical protein